MPSRPTSLLDDDRIAMATLYAIAALGACVVGYFLFRTGREVWGVVEMYQSVPWR